MRRNSRSVISLGLVIVALALRYWQGDDSRKPPTEPPTEASPTTRGGTRLDGQVEGIGVVQRVLPDDTDGSRHQRFILALADGRTVLVAHNIDLAPRLTGLGRGDTVAFFGEYEPNAEGGVIHWTHRDPAGRHVAGWLRHEGRIVQ